MVHVLWAYDGWVNITPLADELCDPGRNIPRSLILGIATLIAVYLGIENAVAAVYCRQLLGGAGVVAISLMVMCSTFILLKGNALAGPHAYFAMARDGLLPRSLCRVHPRSRTPANAVLAQSLWATILTVAGTALIAVPPPSISVGAPGFLLAPILDVWTKLNQTPLYDLLLTYVIFGANLFYLLAIASVFVRLLAELHHWQSCQDPGGWRRSRRRRPRRTGFGPGASLRSAPATKRLFPSWDPTNHGGVQRGVSFLCCESSNPTCLARTAPGGILTPRCSTSSPRSCCWAICWSICKAAFRP